MKLKVRPTEIVVLLKELTDIFRVNAESKSITMITNGLEGSFIAWIDEDKIDKIFTNLMSNALKYTPAGGRINVNFDIVSGEDAVQAVKIEVINTGQIPDDKLERYSNVIIRFRMSMEEYITGERVLDFIMPAVLPDFIMGA